MLGQKHEEIARELEWQQQRLADALVHSMDQVIVDGIFFFSSRRRHTRCGRDWSSDVCSSDLHNVLMCIQQGKTLQDPGRLEHRTPAYYIQPPEEFRSEERRVGKECRSRWS